MKNRVLVIYKSKTGFTEQYARWICEALNGDRVSYEKRNSIPWKDYDTIIYGGGFHAGQIGGLAWFKSRWPELEGKTKIVFATGATPAKAPAVEEALKQNFTDEEWNQVQVFYMQSGLSYEKMGIGDRLMMAAFRKMLKKKEGESEAYKMVQNSYDYSSKAFIQPLVDHCRKME